MKKRNNISVSEKLEASKLKGGEDLKAKTIVVLGFVLMAMVAMATPVSAKTYYTTSSGHAAVRYEHSDISSSMRPFVDHIEYDLVCAQGVGARLYFTNWGKKAVVLYPSLAESIAYNVIHAPEWTGDRSLRSVKYEIIQHGIWPNRMIVDIEYYYRDLKPWETSYNRM